MTNFDESYYNQEILRCYCNDCDDWDMVKVDLCDFCQTIKKEQLSNCSFLIV